MNNPAPFTHGRHRPARNVYRFMLESTEYQLRVSHMFLGVAHPKLAAPRLVEVPRLDSEMAALLDHEVSEGRAIVNVPPHARFTLP